MPYVNCLNCGGEFHARPGYIAQGRSKFCTRRCEIAYRTRQMMGVCPQCGDAFRKRVVDQRFCSRECGNASRVIERPEQKSELSMMRRVWISDLPIADRVGEMITAAGESLGIGYEIAF